MEFKTTIIAVLIAATLSGCGLFKTKEVLIPVPVAVKIQKPQRPVLTSNTPNLIGYDEQVKSAEIDLVLLNKYIADLESLIDANDSAVPTLPTGFEVKRK